MIEPRKTLARDVAVNSQTGSARSHDAVIAVTQRSRGGVSIDTQAGDTLIAITLDEAERIALIEALGGTYLTT